MLTASVAIPVVLVVKRGGRELGRVVMYMARPAITPAAISIGCTFDLCRDFTKWWNGLLPEGGH